MGVNREKAYDDVINALKGPNPVGSLDHMISLQESALDLAVALEAVLPFVEKELECREASYLPEPSKDEEPYLIEAQDALTVIRVALGLKVPND